MSHARTAYLKLAWTDVSFPMVRLQVALVPEHPPAQLVNFNPAAGVAVSVTTVPSRNFAEQLDPQLT